MTARLVRFAFALALVAGAIGAVDVKKPLVVVGRVDTPIHPASALYLRKLIRSAEEDHAALVVVGLSTPGGLGTSMREMTTTILLSKVPVATFVSPAGAQAASAGFFLLLAGDVAAMAPGTNTGAAHPVGSGGEDLPKIMNEKVSQDTQALIRSIAAQRGRNADKAETAVSQSRSFTDKEAKDGGLIDSVARDLPDLLSQLEGREVRRDGVPFATLSLKNAVIRQRDMSAVEKFLGVVSDPSVAAILFLLGTVGLYFELSSPGAILPGIVGGISLLLALYAFSILPVNLAGVALILFGVLLFVAEIKVASHGLLAVGGSVALVVGMLFLFSGKGDAAGYRVDLSIILPAVAMTLGVVGFLTFRTISLRRMPVRTGASGLVGKSARVVRPFGEPDAMGTVQLEGEYWDAYGEIGRAHV